MTPKRIAILGFGQRGSMFADLARQREGLAQVVAVAEPMAQRRADAVRTFGLPASAVFADWRDFTAQKRAVDAVVIATQDRDHVAPAVACLETGYDLLLEKPMSVTLADCQSIAAAHARSGRLLAVCHSLRYQRGFRMVRDLLRAGRIGRIISVDLTERVGVHHYAHSYVRGNWANSDTSSCMLLAKSCHDIDYITFLVDQPCVRIGSVGSLSYFNQAHAPAGATPRCTDGCPHERTCTFSALRNYVYTDRTQWPAAVCSDDHSLEAHLRAVQNGPYGRCVWQANNNVVDHQNVQMEFADGVTAQFNMIAYTQTGGRRLRVYGTTGELEFDESTIVIRPFNSYDREVVEFGREAGSHGGGDARMFIDWLHALHSRDESLLVSNTAASLASHRLVFAAEAARQSGTVLDLTQWRV
jgi:predicted dehydrogenase